MAAKIDINGWTIHHDGFDWWATRDENEEAHCARSYLEAAGWAAFNDAQRLSAVESTKGMR